MTPIISFIMPVYNNTKYFPAAVHSIFDNVSDDAPIELIIVDDGSTDGTHELADSLSELDNRIHVIHQKNQWIYASFNNGIRVSEGEYFFILNSDDLLFENAVNLLLDSIEKYNHPDVIWTKVQWQNVDASQNVISETDMNKNVEVDEYIASKEEVHKRFVFVHSSRLSGNQANLYKRQLGLDHPFRNDVYAGDAFFNLSMIKDVNNMAILSSPLYRYLAYNSDTFNASVGKYYGYEHKMFNEILNSELDLFGEWGLAEEIMDNCVFRRLRSMTYEIEQLAFTGCKLGFDEKIACIFNTISDPLIRNVSSKVGREREYESRILTGSRKLISQISEGRVIPDYVETLIKYLPENYLDDVNDSMIDKELISRAVNDPRNIDHIGKVYYSTKW